VVPCVPAVSAYQLSSLTHLIMCLLPARRTALVASVSAPMPGSAAAVAAAQDTGSSSSSSGEAVDVWVLDMAYRYAQLHGYYKMLL
jgi:uncharacterized circularly permuted ATP-grasp superfamily protein